MFLGEHEYKVDQKGRIAIPPEFREEFRAGVILRRGEDRCITIHTLPQWEEMAQKLATSTPSRSKIRRRNRFIFGTAFKLSFDTQGRIIIPSPLRQYADIEDTAVIAGANNYLELWSKEEWQREQALVDKEAWQIIESEEPR